MPSIVQPGSATARNTLTVTVPAPIPANPTKVPAQAPPQPAPQGPPQPQAAAQAPPQQQQAPQQPQASNPMQGEAYQPSEAPPADAEQKRRVYIIPHSGAGLAEGKQQLPGNMQYRRRYARLPDRIDSKFSPTGIYSGAGKRMAESVQNDAMHSAPVAHHILSTGDLSSWPMFSDALQMEGHPALPLLGVAPKEAWQPLLTENIWSKPGMRDWHADPNPWMGVTDQLADILDAHHDPRAHLVRTKNEVARRRVAAGGDYSFGGGMNQMHNLGWHKLRMPDGQIVEFNVWSRARRGPHARKPGSLYAQAYFRTDHPDVNWNNYLDGNMGWLNVYDATISPDKAAEFAKVVSPEEREKLLAFLKRHYPFVTEPTPYKRRYAASPTWGGTGQAPNDVTLPQQVQEEVRRRVAHMIARADQVSKATHDDYVHSLTPEAVGTRPRPKLVSWVMTQTLRPGDGLRSMNTTPSYATPDGGIVPHPRVVHVVSNKSGLVGANYQEAMHRAAAKLGLTHVPGVGPGQVSVDEYGNLTPFRHYPKSGGRDYLQTIYTKTGDRRYYDDQGNELDYETQVRPFETGKPAERAVDIQPRTAKPQNIHALKVGPEVLLKSPFTHSLIDPVPQPQDITKGIKVNLHEPVHLTPVQRDLFGDEAGTQAGPSHLLPVPEVQGAAHQTNEQPGLFDDFEDAVQAATPNAKRTKAALQRVERKLATEAQANRVGRPDVIAPRLPPSKPPRGPMPDLNPAPMPAPHEDLQGTRLLSNLQTLHQGVNDSRLRRFINDAMRGPDEGEKWHDPMLRGEGWKPFERVRERLDELVKAARHYGDHAEAKRLMQWRDGYDWKKVAPRLEADRAVRTELERLAGKRPDLAKTFLQQVIPGLKSERHPNESVMQHSAPANFTAHMNDWQRQAWDYLKSSVKGIPTLSNRAVGGLLLPRREADEQILRSLFRIAMREERLSGRRKEATTLPKAGKRNVEYYQRVRRYSMYDSGELAAMLEKFHNDPEEHRGKIGPEEISGVTGPMLADYLESVGKPAAATVIRKHIQDKMWPMYSYAEPPWGVVRNGRRADNVVGAYTERGISDHHIEIHLEQNGKHPTSFHAYFPPEEGKQLLAGLMREGFTPNQGTREHFPQEVESHEAEQAERYHRNATPPNPTAQPGKMPRRKKVRPRFRAPAGGMTVREGANVGVPGETYAGGIYMKGGTFLPKVGA